MYLVILEYAFFPADFAKHHKLKICIFMRKPAKNLNCKKKSVANKPVKVNNSFSGNAKTSSFFDNSATTFTRKFK